MRRCRKNLGICQAHHLRCLGQTSGFRVREPYSLIGLFEQTDKPDSNISSLLLLPFEDPHALIPTHDRALPYILVIR